MLTIENLRVETENKTVLQGINLRIKPGEMHAVMGPNGAGKTSLSLALAGHPAYRVKGPPAGGEVRVKIGRTDLLKLKPEERARKGLFVAFQQPVEVTGVSLLSFLRTAYKALYPDRNIPLSEFKKVVISSLSQVGLPESFMSRGIHEGFSGGEKKRTEVAQLLVLKPKFAILDEIDSGLDIDSLKVVALAVSEAVKGYKMGILLITHYQRILYHLKPDVVHVLIDGKIRRSDGMALVRTIERQGYAAI